MVEKLYTTHTFIEDLKFKLLLANVILKKDRILRPCTDFQKNYFDCKMQKKNFHFSYKHDNAMVRGAFVA